MLTGQAVQTAEQETSVECVHVPGVLDLTPVWCNCDCRVTDSSITDRRGESSWLILSLPRDTVSLAQKIHMTTSA
jgi:hypothetical protein